MAQIAVIAVMALMALNEGAQKRKQHVAAAEGLSDAANREMAATTADMAEATTEKKKMESRAIAVAAASGGGIDDPTIVNLIGDLNAEGEYNVMARLYVGEDKAEGLRQSSYEQRAEGEAALNAGYMKAATTVMSLFTGGAAGAAGKIGGSGVVGKATSKAPTTNSGMNTSSMAGVTSRNYNPFAGMYAGMGN